MRKSLITVLALLLCLSTLGSGCILQDVIANLIVTHEACAEYAQREDSASWNDPFILTGYGDQMDDALEKNGYSRSDITDAKLTAAHYGVTMFDVTGHDWIIAGSIIVTRNDGPNAGATGTLIDYTGVSVAQALGQKIPASLNAAGVAIINQALVDFLAGANPTLTFNDSNSSVTPVPSPNDSLIFDWKAWITVQLNVETNVENIPDPWDS